MLKRNEFFRGDPFLRVRRIILTDNPWFAGLPHLYLGFWILIVCQFLFPHAWVYSGEGSNVRFFPSNILWQWFVSLSG